MTRTKVTSKKLLTGGKMTSKKWTMGGIKKPFRYRPGTVALRQIRKYQTGTELLIPKLSFQRLVKEVMMNECVVRGVECLRIQSQALLALQTAAEYYLTEMFSKSQIATIHGKRITVRPSDVQIVRSFSGEFDMMKTVQ